MFGALFYLLHFHVGMVSGIASFHYFEFLDDGLDFYDFGPIDYILEGAEEVITAGDVLWVDDQMSDAGAVEGLFYAMASGGGLKFVRSADVEYPVFPYVISEFVESYGYTLR